MADADDKRLRETVLAELKRRRERASEDEDGADAPAETR